MIDLDKDFQEILRIDSEFQKVLINQDLSLYLSRQNLYHQQQNTLLSAIIEIYQQASINPLMDDMVIDSLSRQVIWQRTFQECRQFMAEKIYRFTVDRQNQTSIFSKYLSTITSEMFSYFQHLDRLPLTPSKKTRKSKFLKQCMFTKAQFQYHQKFSSLTLFLCDQADFIGDYSFEIPTIQVKDQQRHYSIPLELSLMLSLWGITYQIEQKDMMHALLSHILVDRHCIHTAQHMHHIHTQLQSPLSFHTTQSQTSAWRFEYLIQLLFMTPISVWKQCSTLHKHYWNKQTTFPRYYVRLSSLSHDILAAADLSIQQFSPRKVKAWLQLSLSCHVDDMILKEKISRQQGSCGCISPVSLAQLAHPNHLFWKDYTYCPVSLEGKAHIIRTCFDRILHQKIKHPLGPISAISVGLMSLLFEDLDKKLSYIPKYKIKL